MKIHTIGGYNEVGKNMTALETGDDVVLFDSGLFLPAIVEVAERERNPTEKGMRALGALPDDLYLDRKGLRDKVRAMLISHAHLDHVGAVQYNSYRYRAPVIGTPFTVELLKALLEDSKKTIPNRIIPVKPNGSVVVKGKRDYKVEFINMTHSTIQSSLIAVHTPEGIVLYANDYKLDNTPIMGDKPNYKRLKELSRIGVKALIVDCLYAPDDRKTPSEKIARGLLEDVMFTTDNRNSGMIITTFSSHIARLKSITEFGNKLGRKVVFLGRSLSKYTRAAENIGQLPFKNQVQIVSYRKQLEKVLKQINKDRKKYLIVCTGHQGEPGAILDRISRDQTPLRLNRDDHIIFSSKTIPSPTNEVNREQLERRLRSKKVRIFDNVHVSVLPDTEVVINDSDGIKIKEIGGITEEEKGEIKVPAFDPSDLKIKWYDAEVIEHPYKGKIFNIKTKSGRSVSITSGHSLFKLNKGRVAEEKGDNLKVGDYLAIPKKFEWYKEINQIDITPHIDLKNVHYNFKEDVLYYDSIPIINKKLALTNSFARLLGYYLAEGSAPRHISLVINKNEEEILEDIKNSISSCLPSKIKVNERGNAKEIVFGARTLRALFKSWFGENARTKRIPRFVFSANKEFKLNFLGAYINGDGCIDKGKEHFRIRIKTASKKLASDLLYLMSQIGICAKFDHIEIDRRRQIAGNKKVTDETSAYVIRIQGINYLIALKDFLSSKFKMQIEDKMKSIRFSQQLPPESLPVSELNFDEISPKKETYLYDIINYQGNSKKKKKHISQNLIFQQSELVTGGTGKIINGDLLFDPIIEIDVSDYDGKVYDFRVPGPENFIGGFGGLMLHNSGHGGREDLRDLITLVKPQHIIPSHGDLKKLTAGAKLAEELGYKLDKTVHLAQNGGVLELK